MKKLDELMRDSYMGCITDFGDIESIMERISGLSWGALMDLLDEKSREGGMVMIAALLEDEYGIVAEEEDMREIGFPEVLCMLDKENFKWTKGLEVPQYYGTAEEEYEVECLEIDIDSYLTDEEKECSFCLYMGLVLNVLKQAKKTDNLFRLFSAIGIERLFQYLETLPWGEEREKRDWERFQRRKSDGKYFERDRARRGIGEH